MKPRMLPIVMVALVIMTFAGCADKKKAVQPSVQEPARPSALQGAPAWVFDPSVEGGIAAVGSAPMSKAGLQFARTQAIANGRDELARIISVKVNNMLKELAERKGTTKTEIIRRALAMYKRLDDETSDGDKRVSITSAKDARILKDIISI